MKKTTKAMLFSTLVCPGTGQMVLGRWKRGLLFLIPVLVALWIYIKYSIKQAMIVMDKVFNGELSPDPIAIAKMLHESGNSRDLLLMAISIYTILLVWVLAAVDAFILARKLALRERQDQPE